MKVCYLAFVRLPTEKAHGLQIMKTCEALAAAGVEVELIIPGRHSALGDDPFAYYGVKKNFTLTNLNTPDWVRFGPVGFVLSTLWFAEVAKWQRSFWSADAIYSREALVLAQYPLLGRPVFWESHDGVWNLSAWIVSKFAKGIVVVSEGLRTFYTAKGIPQRRITVIRNGIDLQAYTHAESKAQARARLGLPEGLIALYVGAFDGWKGTDTLFAAAVLLQGARLAVIGGAPERIPALQKQYPQVLFLGPRPAAELPGNLAAADVLVLPNTGKSEIAVHFTSPLKLLAYMASGKPIVSTDLPAVRELIDESSAYLVPPDDPQALARGIEEALSDSTATERAKQAHAKIQDYTWERRAQRIKKIFGA